MEKKKPKWTGNKSYAHVNHKVHNEFKRLGQKRKKKYQIIPRLRQLEFIFCFVVDKISGMKIDTFVDRSVEYNVDVSSPTPSICPMKNLISFHMFFFCPLRWYVLCSLVIIIICARAWVSRHHQYSGLPRWASIAEDQMPECFMNFNVQGIAIRFNLLILIIKLVNSGKLCYSVFMWSYNARSIRGEFAAKWEIKKGTIVFFSQYKEYWNEHIRFCCSAVEMWMDVEFLLLLICLIYFGDIFSSLICVCVCVCVWHFTPFIQQYTYIQAYLCTINIPTHSFTDINWEISRWKNRLHVLSVFG